MKRRMTLPIILNRVDPIYKAAENPPSDPAHQAVFIFLHGLGDSAIGIEGKHEPGTFLKALSHSRQES
jgi:lysophospholipase-2